MRERKCEKGGSYAPRMIAQYLGAATEAGYNKNKL